MSHTVESLHVTGLAVGNIYPARTDHAVARASLLVSVSVIAAAAVLAVRYTGVSSRIPALPPGIRD